MIEKSDHHQTKTYFVHLGQQFLHANFHCQSKGHDKVLYGEENEGLNYIYKMAGIILATSVGLILSISLLCDNFSDSSSDDSTFPGLDILCRPSSLRPTNSSGTGDIANASCCRGNSSPCTSSGDSSSSSDSITNETSIAGKRPKRYYWLQILPNKCVKVQLDRLELLAMLDRYTTHLALFFVVK